MKMPWQAVGLLLFLEPMVEGVPRSSWMVS
jgi:hypothetical protein